MVKKEESPTPKFRSVRCSEGTGETETDQVSLSNTEQNLLLDSCDGAEQEDNLFGNHDDTAFFQAIWDDHRRRSGDSAAIGESIISAGDEHNNSQSDQ